MGRSCDTVLTDFYSQFQVKSLDPPPTSQSDSDSEFSDYDEFALSQEIQRETSDEPAPTTEYALTNFFQIH